MKHFSAITLIQNRIQKLNLEIVKLEEIEPEMSADLYFAQIDIDNFNREIIQLTETLEYLIKDK